MIIKKRRILPALALAGLLAVSVPAVTTAYAAAEEERGLPLVQKIAERFGLNEQEVEEVFTQYRAERGMVATARMEDKLEALVAEGTITQEQATLLLEKHAELRADREALLLASPEEHRAYREAHRRELQEWAEAEGIDLSVLGPIGMQREKTKMHRGGMMGWGR